MIFAGELIWRGWREGVLVEVDFLREEKQEKKLRAVKRICTATFRFSVGKCLPHQSFGCGQFNATKTIADSITDKLSSRHGLSNEYKNNVNVLWILDLSGANYYYTTFYFFRHSHMFL